MIVSETFIALEVSNIERATAFYVGVFGATVESVSPGWSSLRVAGVRIGLATSPNHRGGPNGLHFVVDDLAAAGAAIIAAGGAVLEAAIEAAPGVHLAVIEDSEKNVVTLRRA